MNAQIKAEIKNIIGHISMHYELSLHKFKRRREGWKFLSITTSVVSEGEICIRKKMGLHNYTASNRYFKRYTTQLDAQERP